MATRTVRLDAESERALEEIRRATGMPVSAALKQGLFALRRDIEERPAVLPYQIYEKLDLGPGGWSIAPASASKDAVRDAIRKKHGR